MLDSNYGRDASGVVVSLILSGLMVLGGCGPEGGDGDNNGGEVDAGDTTSDAGGEDAGGEEGLEVIGEYDLTFNGGEAGGTEDITADAWGFYELIEYDNDANWAITKNADDAEFNPGTYNRNVWIEASGDGSFYYCTTDFGLATKEEAEASMKAADETDLDAMGCGGFSWNKLTPR